MGKIIPRWEWRTFGENLVKFKEQFSQYKEAGLKTSSEVYILSTVRDDNTKIREDLIDIKALQAVNGDNLEQWNPALKAGFPIAQEQLTQLFATFGVEVPVFARSEYTYNQFLAELIKPNSALRIVDVKKVRYIYTINECTVEYAETEFNGAPRQTVCVEHIDPELVIKTVKELKLYGLPNINYIKAMKQSVGLM